MMIRLEGVHKSYGAIKVLEGMDIQVEEGKSLCLLGKSGCGKSTLLKLLALITRPDKGVLLFDGTDVATMTDAEMDEARREKVSYTFQEPLLIPYITVLENVTQVTGAPKERTVEVLTELGLGDRLDHRPPKLSGGEKKRVDAARAILRGTPILVADEPLSNLDPETSEKVMGMLKAHAEAGGILVFSSVEPTEAKYAVQVVYMEKK
jgi:putative ABC transport system ATP-binding protein